MADRTSAGIFGEIFCKIAEWKEANYRPTTDDLIKFFWPAARQFDFSWEQMGCDDELISLDLCRKVKGKYGQEWQYGPKDNQEE